LTTRSAPRVISAMVSSICGRRIPVRFTDRIGSVRYKLRARS
jgi:hypothetical protein